tara:strand:- start:739 stop:1350 length:612 start_codon:yes stop_codon:yes gene_type:complete
MKNCIYPDQIEVGIDEAGRGCLMGRVYTGAVILPKDFLTDEYLDIRDSKKLSIKNRERLRNYIETHSLSWAVDYADVEEIDKYNILNATLRSMHRAIDKLKVTPEHIAVDGNRFILYTDSEDDIIPHTLVKGGDNKYRNIAAASILAKTHHDEWIKSIIKEDPQLDKYGWSTNMGYGTKKHMNGIKKYGITKFHRLSFKPCQI